MAGTVFATRIGIDDDQRDEPRLLLQDNAMQRSESEPKSLAQWPHRHRDAGAPIVVTVAMSLAMSRRQSRHSVE